MFAEFLMNDGLDKFEKELSKLKGREYVRVMLDMMEYFRPKLRRVESTTNDVSQLPTPIICPKESLPTPLLEYLDKINL